MFLNPNCFNHQNVLMMNFDTHLSIIYLKVKHMPLTCNCWVLVTFNCHCPGYRLHGWAIKGVVTIVTCHNPTNNPKQLSFLLCWVGIIIRKKQTAPHQSCIKYFLYCEPENGLFCFLPIAVFFNKIKKYNFCKYVLKLLLTKQFVFYQVS